MSHGASQEAVSFLFGHMWRHAKGHRGQVVLCLVMSVGANALLLAQPLVFGALINELQSHGLGAQNLVKLLMILLGLPSIVLGFWLLHGVSRCIEEAAAFRTDRQYRHHHLSGLLDLGLPWHAERDSGDTIDKIHKASEGLFQFSKQSFEVVEFLVRAIGTTLILVFFNVYVGLFALALVIVSLLIIYRFEQSLIPQYEGLARYGNRVSAREFDALSNITTVKVLHIEKPVLQGIKEAMWASFPLAKKNRVLVELKWFTGSLLFSLVVVIPLGFYLLQNASHGTAIAVGTVTSLYLYLSRLTDIYYAFSSRYGDLVMDKARVMNVAPLEDAIASSKITQRSELSGWQSLALVDIGFRYETSDASSYQLKGLNFTLNRGERVALIGESGSGKSTFLKVVHGVYQGVLGNILVNGHQTLGAPLADVDLKTTLVPQEPELFSASIRENLTLGLDYTDADIWHALDLSECAGFIKQLPQGLESIINEKGVNMSGGQKQRLALARALLFSHDKEVILLDESTSSVDPENEAKIFSQMLEHFKGRTVIAAVHKMNLLKYFDRIAIFDKGHLVDEGSFDGLLERNPKFRRDWQRYVSEQAAA